MATFRIAANGQLIDAEDRPVALDDYHGVGVIHPVELTNSVWQAWKVDSILSHHWCLLVPRC